MDEITTTPDVSVAQTTPNVAENQTTELSNDTAVSNDVQSDATKEPDTQADGTVTNEQEQSTNDAPTKNWEQIAKDNQASFTRVSQEKAELEKQLKTFQDNQPKYVNEQGKVNPELKARYDFQIDNSEFATYADLATTLDDATRNEVQNLLNQAQRAYQYDKRTYMQKLSEAKNYFNSDIVEEIARRKTALQQQAQAEMQSYEAKAKKERQDACLKQIQEVPELMDLVNPKSENYSQEFDNMLLATFNSYGNIDIPSTTKIVNYLKDLGVKEFQAKQKLETEKANAVINTGTKVSTTTTSMPSADELRANPSLYDKAVKKYGMDKVDAVIMKG